MLQFLQNSEQAEKIIAQDYEMLRPYDHYGRRRVHFFSFTVPAGFVAGTTVGLMKIPAGARILGGEVVDDGTGTSDQAADIGLASFDGDGFIDKANTVADAPAFLGSGLDISTGVNTAFADIFSDNYGYLTEKALWVTATDDEAAVWLAGSVILGSIEIAVD
jgi:hypothetical protein